MNSMQRFGKAATMAGLLAVALVSTSAHAEFNFGDQPPPPGMNGGPRHHGQDDRGGPRGPGGPGMMMGMEGHMLMRMADELGLAPEQRQTIRGFFESAAPGFRKLHEQMRANTTLMMDTQPDDAKYQSVVQQVSQSSAELAQQMVVQSSQLRTQIWGVLTAEQKTKLKAKQAEWRAKAEARRVEREKSRDAKAPPKK